MWLSLLGSPYKLPTYVLLLKSNRAASRLEIAMKTLSCLTEYCMTENLGPFSAKLNSFTLAQSLLYVG
jgi:hypothetical protein